MRTHDPQDLAVGSSVDRVDETNADRINSTLLAAIGGGAGQRVLHNTVDPTIFAEKGDAQQRSARRTLNATAACHMPSSAT